MIAEREIESKKIPESKMSRLRNSGLIGCLTDSNVTGKNYKDLNIISNSDHDQEIATLENIISFLKVATIQHEIDISLELSDIRTVIAMLKKRDAQTGILPKARHGAV